MSRAFFSKSAYERKTSVWSKALNGSGPCVVIKDIERQHVLSNDDYMFIKHNLNKPLRVYEISWDRRGSIVYFAAYSSKSIVTLFPENGCTFEFI